MSRLQPVRWIDPEEFENAGGTSALYYLFEGHVTSGNWSGCLALCSSERRLDLLELVWPCVPDAERANLFAEAYSKGDSPSDSRAFVLRALRWLGRRAMVGFDEAAAATAFAALPQTVEVYRGTVSEEVRSKRIGTSWTLNRDRAIWFATMHGRFRNVESAPVLLSCRIERNLVRALITGREEAEVVVPPSAVAGRFDVFNLAEYEVAS